MASRELDLESGHNPRPSTATTAATTSATPLPDVYGTMASDTSTSTSRPAPQNAHASMSVGMSMEPVQQAHALASVEHAESSRSVPARDPTPPVQPTITLSSGPHYDLEAGGNTLRFGVDIPLPEPGHVATQLAQHFVPPAAMSEFNQLRSSFANLVHTPHQPTSHLPSESQLPTQQQQGPSIPQPSLQPLPQPPNMTRRLTDTVAFSAPQRQRSARATSAGSLEKVSYPFNEGRYPHPSISVSPRSRNFDIGGLNEVLAESSPSASGGGGPPSHGDGGSGQRLLRRRSSEMKMPHIDPTVRERLKRTEEHANTERTKYERKAKVYAQVYSFAIGFQVVLSALITALSAVTTGRSTSITTSVLGGMGTIVASLLARLRGTNEPELSVQRVKDLEAYIRRVEAFIKDKGEESGKEYDKDISRFRHEFEYLLGNGDGERKMTTPSVRVG